MKNILLYSVCLVIGAVGMHCYTIYTKEEDPYQTFIQGVTIQTLNKKTIFNGGSISVKPCDDFSNAKITITLPNFKYEKRMVDSYDRVGSELVKVKKEKLVPVGFKESAFEGITYIATDQNDKNKELDDFKLFTLSCEGKGNITGVEIVNWDLPAIMEDIR